MTGLDRATRDGIGLLGDTVEEGRISRYIGKAVRWKVVEGIQSIHG
jgi:hypothetical protein